MRDVPPGEAVILRADFDDYRPSSLMVNVDYLDLVEKVGENEAWEVLGKLKDLLG